MPSILKSINAGFTAYFGNGKQYFSWIHIDDFVGAVLFAINNNNVSGPINLVSPDYQYYKNFLKHLHTIKSNYIRLPLPNFILKILLGSRSFLLLQSQRVIPAKLTSLGFQFKYNTLVDALNSLKKNNLSY